MLTGSKRSHFERWVLGNLGHVSLHYDMGQGRYTDNMTQMYWEAWQGAARYYHYTDTQHYLETFESCKCLRPKHKTGELCNVCQGITYKELC